jgi:hypothetical protein
MLSKEARGQRKSIVNKKRYSVMADHTIEGIAGIAQQVNSVQRIVE